MLLLHNANKLIVQYINKHQQSFRVEYKRTFSYTPETNKPFRQIPNKVWSKWEQTIKCNCWRFQQAKTYDQIYTEVNKCKIPGIGDKTIKATADYLTNKFNINYNTDCLHLMSPTVKKIIRDNDLHLESICYDDFVAINPLFQKLTMREVIDFLTVFSDELLK
ncbi:hypothetical protein [uncultured Alistipes sp.]|uniref:hypothetical protein n=1 Tax=uncultured Alistipes sp. TaxID=538949 RepID=UPI00259BEB4D|nr:hypothetical protein [uncultured Alistipes sp.]